MEATGFGVMHVDKHGQDHLLHREACTIPPGIPGQAGPRARLDGHLCVPDEVPRWIQLRRDAKEPGSTRDFGKDIIPYIVQNGKAVAHRFTKSCVRSSA